MNIINFVTRLFGNIINTSLYTNLLALLLRNYYDYYYFTVLNYTKLVISNNNYTYTVICQSHCNVITHKTGYYVVL